MADAVGTDAIEDGAVGDGAVGAAAAARVPPEKWRHLPVRVRPEQWGESESVAAPREYPEPLGDPQINRALLGGPL